MGLFDWLFGPAPPKIDVREAYERLQAEEPPLIVDVRQEVETRSGVVPGAVLIPLTEFGRRYEELPRDRPILTICRSNHRSPLAARRLATAGYEVTDVAGGLSAWEAAGLPVVKPEDTRA
ncbi:MAG: rhodanese-like domain-containing protein [Candidatus Promineifilaceae bacterium]|nr:rhodanese-like domain-containing protein [Candidatus Promineifilaceae bacterium]